MVVDLLRSSVARPASILQGVPMVDATVSAVAVGARSIADVAFLRRDQGFSKQIED